MSRNQHRRVIRYARFGLVTLGIIGGAAASAKTFKTSNYNGRYTCRSTSNSDFQQSVTLLESNGKGGFTSGTKLYRDAAVGNTSSCSSQSGAFMTCMCGYTLDLANSNYTVNSDGTGIATLVWIPQTTPANDPLCPNASSMTMTDNWNFVLNTTGTTQSYVSNNNGFDGEPGLGVCSSK